MRGRTFTGPMENGRFPTSTDHISGLQDFSYLKVGSKGLSDCPVTLKPTQYSSCTSKEDRTQFLVCCFRLIVLLFSSSYYYYFY